MDNRSEGPNGVKIAKSAGSLPLVRPSVNTPLIQLAVRRRRERCGSDDGGCQFGHSNRALRSRNTRTMPAVFGRTVSVPSQRPNFCSRA
jgi:hypothetical protein